MEIMRRVVQSYCPEESSSVDDQPSTNCRPIHYDTYYSTTKWVQFIELASSSMVGSRIVTA